ncbi:MAG: hypothetical protein SGILL_003384 [Bacillariaceae sp.]
MLKVDVESGRVLFLAEGVPLNEPLIDKEDEASLTDKKKNALFGCFLLAVATFSTVAMIFFFVMYPHHNDVSGLHNATTTRDGAFVFPFEVQGPLAASLDDVSSPQFQAMQWMIDTADATSKVETTSILERFALVTLFMATSGAHKWTSSLGFLSEDLSVCDWNNGLSGVFCDAERTTILKVLLSK